MLYQVNPILSTVNTMPHFGLMDENLMSREEALLLRSRLHYRCGARRLRQGKLPAGVVTLYDALLSAMRWYILTSQLRRLAGDSKPEIDENLENERLVFALLRKDATLKDRLPDLDRIVELVDRALMHQEISLEVEPFLAEIQGFLDAVGVTPFDPASLPPEDPATF